MKLSLEGIKDKGKWEAAGITLPGYDIEMAGTGHSSHLCRNF